MLWKDTSPLGCDEQEHWVYNKDIHWGRSVECNESLEEIGEDGGSWFLHSIPVGEVGVDKVCSENKAIESSVGEKIVRREY